MSQIEISAPPSRALMTARQIIEARLGRPLRMIVGDLATANPERYSGQAVDPQNDVYEVVDAVMFDALQADAQALLEELKDE